MALDSITSASLWSSAEVILSCALNTDFTSHWDGINWSAVIKLIVEAKTITVILDTLTLWVSYTWPLDYITICCLK